MRKVILGDCRVVLKKFPEQSVHCVVTSPPYYGLRDYNVAGQVGNESTLEDYIDGMVSIFREVGRVLRDDGTVWLNLGDCYVKPSSSRKSKLAAKIKSKDLLMVPARVALALQEDGWWLRSDCIWQKPNPMPESVTDRPTSSHEHVFLLAKNPRYFYDADAVREDYAPTSADRYRYAFRDDVPSAMANKSPALGAGHIAQNPAGRNLRNVWTIPPKPYKGAHFATMPPALAEICIKAGTSERGCCPACGAPWVRIVERYRTLDGERMENLGGWRSGGPNAPVTKQGVGHWRFAAETVHRGWAPSCSCPEHTPRPCTVLDPFGGAGTTGLVADRLGRKSVLIELNPEYVTLAKERT